MPSNTTTKKSETTSTTETTTETMHDFTGRFNKDPVLASHFLECVEHLVKSERVEGVTDANSLWPLYDTMTLDDRKKAVDTALRKARRDAVVTEKNFVPEGVKKPAVPREMFRVQYKLDLAKAGKEYTEAEFKEAWDNVSAHDRDALQAKRDKLLEEYETERQRQLDEQVALGNVMEKPPKGLPNAFFLYKEQVTAKPSRFLKPAEVKKFDAMKSIDQTKFLSERYKAMKESNDKTYQDLVSEINDMTPLYVAEKYEWKVRCARRLLNRAERLGDTEEVDKRRTELLNLENNPPEGYKATSKDATEVALPGDAAKPVENKAKGKGKGKGKAAK